MIALITAAAGPDSTTVILAIVGGLVALYGAALSTKNYLWQRQREEERQRSDIEIDMTETSGFGGNELVIGTTVQREHLFKVRVINRGEFPEYVYEISLRSEKASPFTVPILTGSGSTEVRPRDHEEFVLALDGSQHFAWDEPFVASVRLANGQGFRSLPAALRYPPHHGRTHLVPDPDEVPDEDVYRISPSDLTQD